MKINSQEVLFGEAEVKPPVRIFLDGARVRASHNGRTWDIFEFLMNGHVHRFTGLDGWKDCPFKLDCHGRVELTS